MYKHPHDTHHLHPGWVVLAMAVVAAAVLIFGGCENPLATEPPQLQAGCHEWGPNAIMCCSFDAGGSGTCTHYPLAQ